VRTGSTLYLPAPFGMDTENANFRRLVDAFLAEAMDDRCRVLRKGECTDVVVSRGKATVVCAVNYGKGEDRIRVKLPHGGAVVAAREGNGCTFARVEGEWILDAAVGGGTPRASSCGSEEGEESKDAHPPLLVGGKGMKGFCQGYFRRANVYGDSRCRGNAGLIFADKNFQFFHLTSVFYL